MSSETIEINQQILKETDNLTGYIECLETLLSGAATAAIRENNQWKSFVYNIAKALSICEIKISYGQTQLEDRRPYDVFFEEICNIAFTIAHNWQIISTDYINHLNKLLETIIDGSNNMRRLPSNRISTRTLMFERNDCKSLGLTSIVYFQYCIDSLQQTNGKFASELNQNNIISTYDLSFATSRGDSAFGKKREVKILWNRYDRGAKNLLIANNALGIYSFLSLMIVVCKEISASIGMTFIASKLAIAAGATVLGFGLVAIWPVSLALLAISIGLLLYLKAPAEMVCKSNDALCEIDRATAPCISQSIIDVEKLPPAGAGEPDAPCRMVKQAHARFCASIRACLDINIENEMTINKNIINTQNHSS